MQSAHRYWRVTWTEDSEDKEYRFSLFAPAMQFVTIMQDRDLEVSIEREGDC